ncbi:MAG: HNH endonuclease [Gemmatimonadetes bacterium]|nr:HNH endonuclease [Gemmatimonadota bacterium]
MQGGGGKALPDIYRRCPGISHCPRKRCCSNVLRKRNRCVLRARGRGRGRRGGRKSLRRGCAARPSERCRSVRGYCRSQARYATQRVSVEHLRPRSRGGTTVFENLALACQGCNNHKYGKVAASDPVSGERVSLYHPRQNGAVGGGGCCRCRRSELEPRAGDCRRCSSRVRSAHERDVHAGDAGAARPFERTAA